MGPEPLDRRQVVARNLDTTAQRILAVLSQNPRFRQAFLTPPQLGPEGEILVDLGFGAEPPILRVSAPTPAQAYAALYELACRLMESWRSGAPDGAGAATEAG